MGSDKHIAFGLVFGFVLSRVGATDYDAILGMFALTDLHLMGVIGTAVVATGVFFAVAKRRGLEAANGEPMAIEKKPMSPGVYAGGLLFGVGWAISGTCPGTALSQIGEGQLAGLITFAGIVGGAWIHRRLHASGYLSRARSSRSACSQWSELAGQTEPRKLASPGPSSLGRST